MSAAPRPRTDRELEAQTKALVAAVVVRQLRRALRAGKLSRLLGPDARFGVCPDDPRSVQIDCRIPMADGTSRPATLEFSVRELHGR